MTTQIATNTEIKALLGISGTSKDAMITMWNSAATELLCDVLKVQDIATHTVTKEHVAISDKNYLVVQDFPVDTGETITLHDWNWNAITGFTFQRDSGALRRLQVLDTNSKPTGLAYSELFASYTAGYTIQDTVVVLDDSTLENKTIIVDVAGTETTYTFVASGATATNIVIGADEAATASAIAAKFTGASVSTATVTFPVGYKIRLGTATTTELTVTNATIPQALKMCVAMIVGGFMSSATEKRGGVTSYSLGTKSVTFRDATDRDMFLMMIKTYLPSFGRVSINAV